jgi:PAS domain S-box-containing protein
MKQKPTYNELEKEIRILQNKLAENQKLVDNSLDVIWKMNLKLKFTYVSLSIYDLLGYTQEEWLGRKLSSHTSFAEFIKMAKKTLKGIKDFKNIKYQVIEAVFFHKNGTPVHVEMAGKLLFDSYGFPKEIIGSARNITQRKLVEQKLEKNTKLLRESNATKDKIFSIVAHDLRSPFNSLLGFSYLLMREAKKNNDLEIINYATEINQTLSKTYDYLNNLLEWSSLQTYTLDFKPISFELLGLVNEVIEVLKLQIQSKNIKIKVQIPNELLIFADKNLLNTVLINLISNSIKFCHPDGKITVFTKEVKEFIKCSVQDNGIGISPDNCEKLFLLEESFSLRGTANEKGTGLGLSLCKEFVEKHGGKIWVKSEVGKGSTFHFTIPKSSNIVL